MSTAELAQLVAASVQQALAARGDASPKAASNGNGKTRAARGNRVSQSRNNGNRKASDSGWIDSECGIVGFRQTFDPKGRSVGLTRWDEDEDQRLGKVVSWLSIAAILDSADEIDKILQRVDY